MQKFQYDKELTKSFIEEHWQQCSSLIYTKVDSPIYWYNQHHFYLKDIAEKKEIDHMTVTALFAALSVQNSLKQNKIFLESFLNGISKHTTLIMGKCDKILATSGYYKNEEVSVNSILDILSGEKIKSFFLNLMFPNKETRVCIDRHVLIISGIEQPSLTKKQYLFVEECWKEFAKDVNLLPHQLQSCLWSQYRVSMGKNLMFD